MIFWAIPAHLPVMTSRISSAAHAAQALARRDNGQFGAQERTEPDVSLTKTQAALTTGGLIGSLVTAQQALVPVMEHLSPISNGIVVQGGALTGSVLGVATLWAAVAPDKYVGRHADSTRTDHLATAMRNERRERGRDTLRERLGVEAKIMEMRLSVRAGVASEGAERTQSYRRALG